MLFDHLRHDRVRQATLYLGTGELEEPRFVQPHLILAARLDSRHYRQFHFDHQTHTSLDHGSGVLLDFRDSAIWVFTDPLTPIHLVAFRGERRGQQAVVSWEVTGIVGRGFHVWRQNPQREQRLVRSGQALGTDCS